MDFQFQLTIFFALLFVVLAWNAGLLWVLSNWMRRVDQRVRASRERREHFIRTVGNAVRATEDATTQLVAVSARIRDAASRTDETLGRADDWARYGLAKLDFNTDRVAESLRKQTDRLGRDIREPLFKTSAAIQGVHALLTLAERWGGTEGGRRRAAHVLDPLDTTLTFIEAVTAVGELFAAPRARDDVDAGA